jgi:hypothetical protein
MCSTDLGRPQRTLPGSRSTLTVPKSMWFRGEMTTVSKDGFVIKEGVFAVAQQTVQNTARIDFRIV